jgi:hypothetical protein
LTPLALRLASIGALLLTQDAPRTQGFCCSTRPIDMDGTTYRRQGRPLLWSAMVSIPRAATMSIDARPWQILSLGLLLTYGMLVLGFDQAAMVIEIEIVEQPDLMPFSLFTRPVVVSVFPAGHYLVLSIAAHEARPLLDALNEAEVHRRLEA